MPDQLDDMAFIGKEAADHFEPGMDAPGWDKMSARLDEEMPVKKKRRLAGWWWVAPLMVAGALVVLRGGLWEEDPRGGEKGLGEGIVGRNDAEYGRDGSQRRRDTEEKLEERIQKNMSGDSRRDVREKGFEEEVVGRNDVEYGKDGSQKRRDAEGRLEGMAGKKGEVSRDVRKSAGYTGYADATLAYTSVIQEDKSLTSRSLPPYIFTRKLTDAPGGKIPDAFSGKNAGSAFVGSSSQKSVDQESVAASQPPASWKKQRLELALLGGTDLSSDALSHTDKAGISLGVMAGYRLGERWTLRAGLIHTKKNYTVDGDQYRFSYAYPSYKLDEVSGYCNMWEIPLHIRWTARPGKKISPFLSGGLSTYLMTRERYRYTLSSSYDTIHRARSYNDTKAYPLGIIHLSTGIRTRLTHNIGISIEPYAKIPLRGMGSGDLRLMSLGGYGSVHWTF